MLSALLIAAAAAAGPAAEVRVAVDRFLAAFENLDRESFRASFEDGASVFFPAPEPADRCDGRACVERRFDKVFAQIRAAGPVKPPYHRLEPRGLEIQMLGRAAALVTFELRNAERLGRRTLVLRKTAGTWRIVHLHASNAAAGSP